MAPELAAKFIVYLPLLLIELGQAFAILADGYLGKRNRRIMLLIVVLCARVALADGLGYLLETRIVNVALRTWNAIVGYAVRPVILLLFLCIVGMPRRKWPFWALIGANALIHLTALVTDHVCFGFPGNVFHRGPLGYTAHIVSGILLAFLLWQTVREFRRIRRSEMWIPVWNALLVVTAVVLDSAVFTQKGTTVSFTTISMVACTLFFYIWLHLQFVREHEQALRAEQRVQIMMTQIQPHFLFNALNTIRALYAKDPPLADRTMENFSAYLRQNLESLSQTELVPITEELEHTRLYAEIETLRFPNVRVAYRIEDTDFAVPALTIQPLVENAIRHGVRSRAKGLVTVSTAWVADGHRVTVEDNGVGFNPKQQGLAEGPHIGLRNVRERIEQMCGGTMTVESESEKGTSVTLLIPERKEQRK